MFPVNRVRPALFGARGSAGGRRGHGLSRSLSVSEAMLSIFTLSVTPARLRLSVRTRFTLSARRLSAAVIESCLLAKLWRSEEPTSELQSQSNLGFRLLLEQQ